MKFYTYGHYTKGGRLFYVGKGSGKRLFSKCDRNKHWHNIVKDGGFDAKIFAFWSEEQDALEHEKLLISCFNDMGGFRLCNKTAGGDGVSGYKHSESARRSMSEKLKGRPAPNKGVPSPLRGRVLSEEHKEKLRAAKLGKVSPRKGVVLRASSKERISKAFKGRVWVNNGVASRLLEKSEAVALVNCGWQFGRADFSKRAKTINFERG